MSDNRSFEDVVRSIEMSENDVDKILKAARLSRNEKPKMSDSRFETICMIAVTTMMFIMLFGFMALTVIVG